MRILSILLFSLFVQQSIAQIIPDRLIDFYEEIIYESVDESVKILEGKIKENNTEPWYYWMLGNVYEIKSDFKKSEKLFNKCIKIDARFSAAYASLARLNYYYDTKDYVTAQTYINKAIEYGPKDNNLILDRGFILLGLKKFKDAMRDADFALKNEVDPIHSVQLKIEIYFAVGNKSSLKEYLKTNHIAENADLYDTDFCIKLGEFYEEMNESKNACLLYQKAAEPYRMMEEKIPDAIVVKLKNCH